MKEFNDADMVRPGTPVTTLTIDEFHKEPRLVWLLVDQEAADGFEEQSTQMNLTPAKARKIAIALLKAADKAEEGN